MWQRLFKSGSSLEGGTLQQLRNLINRRNVSASTKVKGHANDVQDFLELVVKCHLVAVSMHYFSMDNVSDRPHTSAFPSNLKELPTQQKWKILHNELCHIVDKYVIPKQYLNVTTSENVPSVAQCSNPHAQRVDLEHQYTSTATPRPTVRHLPPSILREMLLLSLSNNLLFV